MEGKYYKNTVLVADKSQDFRQPSEIMLGSKLGMASSVRREIDVIGPKKGAAGSYSVNFNFPLGNMSSVPSLQVTADFSLVGTGGFGLPADGTVAAANANLWGKLGIKREALSDLQTNATVELNGTEWNSKPQDIREVLINTLPLSQLAKLSDAPAGQLFDSYNNASINNSLKEGINAVDTVSSNGLGNNWKFELIGPGYVKATDTYTFRVVYEEVIKAQPFQFNDPNPRPFRNLDNFKMRLDMLDLRSAFLAMNTADVKAATALTCTNAVWKMLVHTWNPSLQLKIPDQIVYNSPKIVRIKSQEVTLTKAPLGNINMGGILLDTVPTAFFFFAKQNRPTDLTDGTRFGVPDQYAAIDSLAVDAVNDTGIFQNHTTHQLYDVCTKNGYNERYAKWAMQQVASDPDGGLGAGSFMILKPDDFPAGEEQGFISHSNTKQAMTFRPVLRGHVTDATSYTIHLFAMYDDLVLYNEANNGLYASERPVISPVKLASSNVVFEDNSAANNHIVGGSWASSLWSGLQYMRNLLSSPQARMLSRGIRNSGAVPFLADTAPLGRAASAFGYGTTKKATKKATKKKGGEILDIGRGKSGGAKLSVAQLNKMLDKAYK